MGPLGMKVNNIVLLFPDELLQAENWQQIQVVLYLEWKCLDADLLRISPKDAIGMTQEMIVMIVTGEIGKQTCYLGLTTCPIFLVIHKKNIEWPISCLHVRCSPAPSIPFPLV